jgi:hypothetical protein
MKRIAIYSLVCVLAIGAVVTAIFFASRNSLFSLKTINFVYEERNAYVDSLRPALERPLQKYIGQSLWHADIFAMESFLKKQTWIETASVTRSFPNEIVITVEPKQVVANILRSPSMVQPVAADSTVMDPVDIAKSPSAPLLSHRSFLERSDLRKNALAFLKELPEEGSFSRKNISEILPKNTRQNNQFKVLLKNSKAEVFIDNENVPLKAARVSRVIDYLSDKEMEDCIIDANFSKKVLVRPRNHR